MSLDKRSVLAAATRTDRGADVGMADRADIARHADELYGTPADPDFTPPEQRHVPPGRVLLEWIGDSSPLGLRQIQEAVRMKLIPATVVAAWEQLAEKMTTRIPGVSYHAMTVARDGMSETVRWGAHPGTYIQEVSAHDADICLSSTFGAQFRLVGKADQLPDGGQPADRDLFLLVPPSVRDRVRSIRVVDGPEEPLAGITTAAHPRARAGVGVWID